MNLTQVITTKIVITICFWCGPLLLGPKSLFQGVGIPVPEPEVFVRLLGAAYAALVVAYYHGLMEAKSGGSATATVRMGLVSNALAAFILGIYGINGAWASWSSLAQVYMWASFGAASLIAIGLIATGWNQITNSAPTS